MSKPGKHPLILFVDDEPQLRDMLSSVLSMEGLAYETARDGQEAIDILAQAPAQARIMLLDLTMPVLDGAGVVRWLVEHPDIRAQTKIILMSANHNLRAAMDLTHDGELAKPFGVDQLLALIEQFA
ncbi:MAG: response regulator [Ktedonobacterales bacterium]|nr:response regulator [Ktedonobacterales bacterium]